MNKRIALSLRRRFRGLSGLAELVRSLIQDKVKPLLAKLDFAQLSTEEEDLSDSTIADQIRQIRQQRRLNKIVGFEDEADTLINSLNEEFDELEIISITGMPGLGKTTLASKIYDDPRLRHDFPVQIWVNMSDNLDTRKVLLTILRHFTAHQPPVEELAEVVRGYLKVAKFLIVMDDVWTTDDWNEIKTFLPIDNKLGRVLITSRSKIVARHANPRREPHNLRFLSEEESWELLQYEIYGKLKSIPEELVTYGEQITTKCQGLPLSIIVMAKILAEKVPRTNGSISSVAEVWNDHSKNFRTYLLSGDKNNLLREVISLSYTRLPYDLRDCFLYLGMFPKYFSIPAEKLTWLWIAEGFIKESPGKSLEQIGEEILRHLADWSLVMVYQQKPNGDAKVYRIHEAISEFCREEAAFDNLNLFQEISMSSQGDFEPSLESIEDYRRLCLHSDVREFLSRYPRMPKARSFLCFTEHHVELNSTEMRGASSFMLLRVFDGEGIIAPKLPSKVPQANHLRYLAFHNISSHLPMFIPRVRNLQTLIVATNSSIIDFPGDIRGMRQLRHFKSKASIILKGGENGDGGENLQTLGRLSPQSCTTDVFIKARNLITLAVQGDLNTLDAESNCLQNLALLNKLKLVHDGHPWQHLPESNRFPPNLKILVLEGTSLDWEKISVLSMLSSLKELKLKKNAFRGDSLEAIDGDFCHLEVLHIEDADLVHWTVSGDSFAKLRILVLKKCEKLREVPSVFDKNLEKLYMERVTPSAVSSAIKIEKAKRHATGSKGRLFKLEVAPADRIQES